ncbi:hypothetical protein HAZT_HAZT006436 [Hyalella azteca]|uniref:Photolyase/cryptochrome alpha/beta domain-containing protein n=1 Tax=Hyalella azteca TaxID=294128 RepID=A0A6A0GV87_HYAAZ|nr:hypothetical protein HAZT_HAZT006436 [Hyalella azteca]
MPFCHHVICLGARFLLQCLEDVDNSLRNLNSRLFVVRGQPANVLPQLFKEWNTTVLSFEEDPEPFGRARDASIIGIAREMGIEVVVRTSHTLYKLDEIIEKKGGKPPLTYKTFQNILAMMDPPPAPVPPIVAGDLQHAFTPIQPDHDDKYGVPNLEHLGFETEQLPPTAWKGGETEALQRLKHHLERKAWVASFGRPKMTPQSLFACPTGLSPYLRFGCLSARKFYTELNELYTKIKKVPAPVSLHGHLLWREFFYTAATNNPKFDHMKGNPICVQIPWDKNPEALAKWAHWLNLHFYSQVFDELLLDADWSVNAGSWMWLSCSSFFQQFFHCYCPVRYGRKADPNGDFIRTYLPVLKNFPTKYIHEPWMAPESVQSSARCIIGQHYPLPMVDHATQSQTNIERMKQVYRQLAHYRATSTLPT